MTKQRVATQKGEKKLSGILFVSIVTGTACKLPGLYHKVINTINVGLIMSSYICYMGFT